MLEWTFLLLAGLAVAVFFSSGISRTEIAHQKIASKPRTLAELLALKPEELESGDIALINLLCAEGLPGAENLSIDEGLATLDQWAQHVKSETDRNQHHFRENPADYYDSELKSRN